MRENIKNTKRSTLLFSTMILSGIIIIIAFIVFGYANGKRIRNNNQQYLINDTKQTANYIRDAVLGGLDNVGVFSQLLSEDLEFPNVDIRNYQKIINNSVFDFMEFADRDGMDHNIAGGISDARDRQYYLDAKEGNTGYELIFNSRATHETLLMFYSPVYFEGEFLGSCVGVFQASNKLGKLLRQEYFGQPANAYLCTKEGRLIASSEGTNTGEEVYLQDVINTEDTAIVESAINNVKGYIFTLTDGKTSGYAVRVPNVDWCLVQIFPPEVNEQMIVHANAIALVLVAVLFVVFAGLLYVVYYSHLVQEKRIVESLNEIEYAKRENEEQLDILRSMAGFYYSMHLINLKTNQMVEYKAEKQVLDVTKNNVQESATNIMHMVMEKTMSDEWFERGNEFSDISTLAERMKNRKIIFMDLLGKNVGWIRMSFITIEADTDGFPIEVICTTQIIDEEKKNEEKLVRESLTDEMTGCYNRRAYEDDLLYYPEVPTEDNYVYIAMDINELKIVNDTLGHEAGDEMILGAVKCMKQCFGPHGKIFRTGGDEFVAMIFADENRLEAIKKDFENITNLWSGNIVDHVSVSCGYVTKREFPEMTVREMEQLADARMYEAKTKYYKTKGVDRRGQLAAHSALCALYTKILKMNLTEDTYQIVNVDVAEQSEEKGYADSCISKWLMQFGKTGQVHPDDLAEYLAKTDLEYMRNYFRGEKKSLGIHYKRKFGDVYKWVMMEIIPADDYADDNQSMFLYVKSIDK